MADVAAEASARSGDGEGRAAQSRGSGSPGRLAERRKPSQRATVRASCIGKRPSSSSSMLCVDAGVDGVGVADLSKLVRGTFKSFKVRDHGFAQMRQYVASLADIKVEKRGSDYFADAGGIGSAGYAMR